MPPTLWTNFYFRVSVLWINLLILLSILTYHSYRLCYLQKGQGGKLMLLKCISFKHISFVVIICAILPALQQAIEYTPQQYLSDETCRFTVIFGMVCLASSKFALHLFVTMRSQIACNTTNIWYKLGLIMTLSDVLWIVYILSGIPTITAVQKSVLCTMGDCPLHVYIWFAMNDFVIGIYCVLAFIMPLRKYVWLEESEMDNSNTDIKQVQTQHAELRSLAIRIMLYSSVALVSTMIITAIASVVSESSGVLFAIDSTINALCVTLQFFVLPI
eukprot:443367_1